MARTLDEIADEAMHLPAETRAVLAERLVESLHKCPEPEIEQAWGEEARRRLEEVRSGKVRPIPGDEVLAEMRRLLDR